MKVQRKPKILKSLNVKRNQRQQRSIGPRLLEVMKKFKNLRQKQLLRNLNKKRFIVPRVRKLKAKSRLKVSKKSERTVPAVANLKQKKSNWKMSSKKKMKTSKLRPQNCQKKRN